MIFIEHSTINIFSLIIQFSFEIFFFIFNIFRNQFALLHVINLNYYTYYYSEISIFLNNENKNKKQET